MSRHKRRPQRGKGSIPRRQLTCNVQPKFKTREEAKLGIQKLKNKGQRGTARLQVYRCATCSKKEEDVFHFGHKRKADYKW